LHFSSIAMLTVLVLAATAGDAAAQAPTPAAVSEQQAAIRALRDSQRVRLVTPALARQEGRLLGHEGDTLMLDRGADSLLHIWAMDVDSLWVRGTSWKTGAIVGSALGTVAGAVLGVVVADVCNEGQGEICPSSGAAGLVLGLGGLVSGGLIGSLIGSAVPKWHSRWP
jgi:hypothetical protein